MKVLVRCAAVFVAGLALWSTPAATAEPSRGHSMKETRAVGEVAQRNRRAAPAQSTRGRSTPARSQGNRSQARPAPQRTAPARPQVNRSQARPAPQRTAPSRPQVNRGPARTAPPQRTAPARPQVNRGPARTAPPQRTTPARHQVNRNQARPTPQRTAPARHQVNRNQARPTPQRTAPARPQVNRTQWNGQRTPQRTPNSSASQQNRQRWQPNHQQPNRQQASSKPQARPQPTPRTQWNGQRTPQRTPNSSASQQNRQRWQPNRQQASSKPQARPQPKPRTQWNGQRTSNGVKPHDRKRWEPRERQANSRPLVRRSPQNSSQAVRPNWPTVNSSQNRQRAQRYDRNRASGVWNAPSQQIINNTQNVIVQERSSSSYYRPNHQRSYVTPRRSGYYQNPGVYSNYNHRRSYYPVQHCPIPIAGYGYFAPQPYGAGWWHSPYISVGGWGIGLGISFNNYNSYNTPGLASSYYDTRYIGGTGQAYPDAFEESYRPAPLAAEEALGGDVQLAAQNVPTPVRSVSGEADLEETLLVEVSEYVAERSEDDSFMIPDPAFEDQWWTLDLVQAPAIFTIDEDAYSVVTGFEGVLGDSVIPANVGVEFFLARTDDGWEVRDAWIVSANGIFRDKLYQSPVYPEIQTWNSDTVCPYSGLPMVEIEFEETAEVG